MKVLRSLFDGGPVDVPDAALAPGAGRRVTFRVPADDMIVDAAGNAYPRGAAPRKPKAPKPPKVKPPKVKPKPPKPLSPRAVRAAGRVYPNFGCAVSHVDPITFGGDDYPALARAFKAAGRATLPGGVVVERVGPT